MTNSYRANDNRLPMTVGARYGRLVLLAEGGVKTNPSGVKVRQALVRCDCGVEREVHWGNLRHGQVQSCGCRLGLSRPAEVQIGERYGQLVILGEAPKKQYKTTQVKQVSVRCDCGVERAVGVNGVKRGTIKSCGCLRRKNPGAPRLVVPTGARYGNLVVLGEVDERRYGQRVFNVMCNCGTERKIVLDSLGKLSGKCYCGVQPIPKKMITAWGETKHLRGWSRDPRCRVTYACLQTRIYKQWNPELAMTTPPFKETT